MHRGKRALVLWSLLFVAVAAVLGAARPDPADAGWKPRYRRWTSPIAPGLTLVAIKDTWGPVRMRVLEVDPGTALTVDVALEGDLLAGVAPTSAIARAHGAIAAVNGDFFFPSGRPTHPLAEDGALLQTSPVWGQNVAVSRDERDVYLGHPVVGVQAVEVDSGTGWAIDRWNWGKPRPGQVFAYTPAGGKLAAPPATACAARLYPAGELVWGEGQMGVGREYVVDRARCSENAMYRWGGVVVATPIGAEPSAAAIAALLPGESVRITWSFGWRSVLDAVGGLPLLVQEGRVAAFDCSTSFCRHRHPRTGVGVRADGTLLLVTVDGRDPSWSVGMTLGELAQQFMRLGAVRAVNLDGGGSTTMVVNGKVVNRPADWRGERPVSTALLVLPGADEAEPAPLPAWTEPAPPPEEPPPPEPAESAGPESSEAVPADAALAPARDPASIGGMLDALARGELGLEVTALPPEAREVLRVYRQAGRMDGTSREGR